MEHRLEIRSAPLEVRGRRIAGLAVPWGQRARVPEHGEETFTAGAFGDDAGLKPVALTLEHGGAKIGEVQPANSERGLEVEGEYSGDLEGRDRFSIEFRARKDTRSQGLRIVHDAQLVGLASVRRPAYEGAEIEARQGASLTLLEGPPGGGKSQELERLIAADDIDAASDLTRLWAALGLVERGSDGRFPIRESDDPVLALSLYVKTVAVREGLRSGLKMAVTSSARDQAERWRAIAEEAGASFEFRTLDPGEGVATARLTDSDGNIEPECTAALARWYGSRSAELSLSRRRLLAAI